MRIGFCFILLVGYKGAREKEREREREREKEKKGEEEEKADVVFICCI